MTNEMDRKKLLAAMAVPAVLALGGGTALAQATHNTSAASSGQVSAAQQQAHQENTKADPDNVQQGDQKGPDGIEHAGEKAESGEVKGPDRDNLQQGPGQQLQQGDQSAPDTAGSSGK
ncbi:MAG: hypothetical protein K6T51_04855 [Rubrobacteraceae bacterium]|uniref:hypothetical protein n=1 Tax=Rubrobacter naiadicus TaxID=1392641 RepID=UPI002362E0A1|nr:hypothetical protein [Rubrobacter naiadicus]MBX6762058.1 hypothetical protein [Rubrobacteraceae bacterium]MCL6437917.1 hypothetical protein [Rubrobacteraceae bacterium]